MHYFHHTQKYAQLNEKRWLRENWKHILDVYLGRSTILTQRFLSAFYVSLNALVISCDALLISHISLMHIYISINTLNNIMECMFTSKYRFLLDLSRIYMILWHSLNESYRGANWARSVWRLVFIYNRYVCIYSNLIKKLLVHDSIEINKLSIGS